MENRILYIKTNEVVSVTKDLRDYISRTFCRNRVYNSAREYLRKANTFRQIQSLNSLPPMNQWNQKINKIQNRKEQAIDNFILIPHHVYNHFFVLIKQSYHSEFKLASLRRYPAVAYYLNDMHLEVDNQFKQFNHH
ncbi:hypothetical protein BpHYR1_018292 [Brachionus plicatilis]|uniref:Uncharacterized protein n=1 Tax=Brachionus plicatilis TaxID=10195 RepID=A0A3M7PA34_BRAPC|nr:hypothetical protein BpHYR1_018292 [Brachionus plicatilis]